MIKTMLGAGEGVSDLVFSPGRPAQVEKHGELDRRRHRRDVPMLEAEHTARVARELIGGNEHALRTLKENGACDISYSVAERRALPRQRIPPARHLRHRHARDRDA